MEGLAKRISLFIIAAIAAYINGIRFLFCANVAEADFLLLSMFQISTTLSDAFFVNAASTAMVSFTSVTNSFIDSLLTGTNDDIILPFIYFSFFKYTVCYFSYVWAMLMVRPEDDGSISVI